MSGLRESIHGLWGGQQEVLFPRMLYYRPVSQKPAGGAGMRMTEAEFRNERLYVSTMQQVKKLLKMGLITVSD